MKCKDLRFNFPDYLKSRAEADTRQLIEEHLSGCKKCAEEINRMRQTMEILDGFKLPEPDEKYFINFLPNLNDKLENRKSTENAPGWLIKFALPFSAMALSLFLIFIVFKTNDSSAILNNQKAALVEDKLDDEESLVDNSIDESVLAQKIENSPIAQEKIKNKIKESISEEEDIAYAQNTDIEHVINNLTDEESSIVVDKIAEKTGKKK